MIIARLIAAIIIFLLVVPDGEMAFSVIRESIQTDTESTDAFNNRGSGGRPLLPYLPAIEPGVQGGH